MSEDYIQAKYSIDISTKAIMTILTKEKKISYTNERVYWKDLSIIWKQIFWDTIKLSWKRLCIQYERIHINNNDPKDEEKWIRDVKHQFSFENTLLLDSDLPKVLYEKIKFLLRFNLINEIPTDEFLKELIYQINQLEYINCRRQGLTDLKPLKNLKSLKTLTCSDNSLLNLEDLAKLENLETLFCINTSIESLEFIRGHKKLTRLYCGINKIKDLEPLNFVDNLQFINCRKTKVSKKEIKRFYTNKPSCIIEWKDSWLF